METPEKLEERLMLASEKLGHDELIRMKDRIDEYYRKRYYEIVLEKHREYGLSKNDSVVLSPMKE